MIILVEIGQIVHCLGVVKFDPLREMLQPLFHILLDKNTLSIEPAQQAMGIRVALLGLLLNHIDAMNWMQFIAVPKQILVGQSQPILAHVLDDLLDFSFDTGVGFRPGLADQIRDEHELALIESRSHIDLIIILALQLQHHPPTRLHFPNRAEQICSFPAGIFIAPEAGHRVEVPLSEGQKVPARVRCGRDQVLYAGVDSVGEGVAPYQGVDRLQQPL
jgi:hypothetical protein